MHLENNLFPEGKVPYNLRNHNKSPELLHNLKNKSFIIRDQTIKVTQIGFKTFKTYA